MSQRRYCSTSTEVTASDTSRRPWTTTGSRSAHPLPRSQPPTPQVMAAIDALKGGCSTSTEVTASDTSSSTATARFPTAAQPLPRSQPPTPMRTPVRSRPGQLLNLYRGHSLRHATDFCQSRPMTSCSTSTEVTASDTSNASIAAATRRAAQPLPRSQPPTLTQRKSALRTAPRIDFSRSYELPVQIDDASGSDSVLSPELKWPLAFMENQASTVHISSDFLPVPFTLRPRLTFSYATLVGA